MCCCSMVFCNYYTSNLLGGIVLCRIIAISFSWASVGSVGIDFLRDFVFSESQSLVVVPTLSAFQYDLHPGFWALYLSLSLALALGRSGISCWIRTPLLTVKSRCFTELKYWTYGHKHNVCLLVWICSLYIY